MSVRQWACMCSRCDPNKPVEERCLCPADVIVNHQQAWHGTLTGYTDGCPIHLPTGDGCPNPDCGETWIKAFQWPHCDACGWTAPIIEEEPTALDLSA